MVDHADQVGIAVIGCGYWGVNYIRIFSELRHSRVVAICDSRIERLHEIAQRYPDVLLTTDVDQLLELDGISAVVICTGAASHYWVASRCLAANKHVLVEKPLVTNVADGNELIHLAQTRNLTLMVGHTFLYNSAVRKVKECISPAEMGQTYYLYSCRTNLGPIRQDVNALWDLAPHDISIFNYLLDSTPDWVSAVGAKVLSNEREDVGFISLGYPNNVIGNIHVSWADPNKVRNLVVVGSHRRVVFDDLNTQEKVRIYEKGVKRVEPEVPNYGEHQLLLRDGDVISPYVQASEPLKVQCTHFLECISQGTRPLTDGRAGLDVVQVLTAIDTSIEQSGAPVRLEPAHRFHGHLMNNELA